MRSQRHGYSNLDCKVKVLILLQFSFQSFLFFIYLLATVITFLLSSSSNS